MLEVRCPRCRTLLSAEKTPVGARVGCRKCGHVFPLDVAFTDAAATPASAPASREREDILYIPDTGAERPTSAPRSDAARRTFSGDRSAGERCAMRPRSCSMVRSLAMIGCLVGAVMAAGLWSKSMRRCGGSARHGSCPSSVSARSADPVECLIGCEEPTPAVRSAGRPDSSSLPLAGHSQPIQALAVSPDGKWIATGGLDNSVRLWNRANGQEAATLATPGPVQVVAFSPDGVTLAAAARDSVQMWNVREPSRIGRAKSLPMSGHVASLAFSPDGRRLAVGDAGKLIRLLSADPADHPDESIAGAQAVVIEGHDGTVRALAFSPDGKTLASGSDDKTVRLWNVETWKELGRAECSGVVSSVAFSPDGKSLVAGDFNGQVWVWAGSESGLHTRLHLATAAPGQRDWRVNCVAVSPDGAWFAAGGGDGTAVVRSMIDGAQVRVLPAIHPGGVNGIAFSPEGANLVTGGADQLARIWDAGGLGRRTAH